MDIHEYILSGKIETYVMGLCSAEEEKEIEQLRTRYPELDKAIIACEMEMENNLVKQQTQPGDETDKKILDWLDTQKAPAQVVQMKSPAKNLLKYAAAVAIVLLLVSGGLNIYQYRQTKILQAKIDQPGAKSEPGLPERDYLIMKNPSITPVAMYGVGNHAICRCTMFWDKKTGKVYIMIHHLPESSSARDYQLWAMVNGKPVSVGIVQDNIRGRFIEMDNVPPGATAFTVTLEKAGGSLTPSVDETYLEGRI
jgi:anti-sigma-K factor RskA